MSVRNERQALPQGITLACRRTGPPGPPQVVFLHGFPEAAFIWDEVMLALAQGPQPLACLAPNLRGFDASSAPAEVSAYRAKPLVADLAALLAQLRAGAGPLPLLVAHDWGGALAWNLAAQHPELLQQLLVINAPHPATFLRELRHNPAQQAASAYMNFLCRPDAERLLAENDFARLWRFFGPSPTWLSAALRERYRALWGPGGSQLSGPLNYYRASPLRPADGPDSALHTLMLPDAAVTVPVPTTVLWAEADVALLPALLDGLQRWVPQLQVQRVPGATHWLVHEQPQRVVQAVQAALRAAPLASG
jgi:pimeloyl-ACP methyl ester carboxylesterase